MKSKLKGLGEQIHRPGTAVGNLLVDGQKKKHFNQKAMKRGILLSAKMGR